MCRIDGKIERIRKKYIYNAIFSENPAIIKPCTENWWCSQDQLINAIYIILFLISARFCMILLCFVKMKVVGNWWFMCLCRNSFAFLPWKHASGLFMVVTTEIMRIHQWWWWTSFFHACPCLVLLTCQTFISEMNLRASLHTIFVTLAVYYHDYDHLISFALQMVSVPLLQYYKITFITDYI